MSGESSVEQKFLDFEEDSAIKKEFDRKYPNHEHLPNSFQIKFLDDQQENEQLLIKDRPSAKEDRIYDI